MGQVTIIISYICIESCACSCSNIIHGNKLAHGYEYNGWLVKVLLLIEA